MTNQEKTGGNKPERDEKGRLLPGNTANPAGRPKGSLSLVSILKRELEKNAPSTTEEKRTFAEEFVREILKKVFVEKDVRMMIEVMNRVDGMPKRVIDLGFDEEVSELEIIVKSKDAQEADIRGRQGDN